MRKNWLGKEKKVKKERSFQVVGSARAKLRRREGPQGHLGESPVAK